MSQSEPACLVVPDPNWCWGELVIWLPGMAEEVLDTLARQEPTELNVQSADFRTCRTMLWLRSPCGIEVQVDVRALGDDPFYWRYGDNSSPGFAIVLLSEIAGRYASHRLDSEAYESLVCGLQGATASSGPNYQPWRIFGNEFMDEHEGAVDEPEPNIIRPTPLFSSRRWP